jgi:hypothetical protein
MQYFFSRFAFVFLIFSVVISGYISEILSCQMRKFIYENIYFRHLIAILMIFVFIMLEGGWSLNPELDKLEGANNNWSSGNVIDTMLVAFGIYIVFVISAKSRLIPNLIFYGIVLSIYLINTHVNFLWDRKLIDEDAKDKILLTTEILFVIAILVLLYGFIDYVIYQKAEYGKKFKWDLFLLGTSRCKHIRL